MNPHPEMTLHPNPTSPPGKAATEGLDSRCGLVGIEGPEKAAVRLFQRTRAKPMDARLWSPTGTPFTTSAIKSFFEQEIYKHPTEWWGAFIWLLGRFSSVTQKSTSRSCWAGKCGYSYCFHQLLQRNSNVSPAFNFRRESAYKHKFYLEQVFGLHEVPSYLRRVTNYRPKSSNNPAKIRRYTELLFINRESCAWLPG